MYKIKEDTNKEFDNKLISSICKAGLSRDYAEEITKKINFVNWSNIKMDKIEKFIVIDSEKEFQEWLTLKDFWVKYPEGENSEQQEGEVFYSEQPIEFGVNKVHYYYGDNPQKIWTEEAKPIFDKDSLSIIYIAKKFFCDAEMQHCEKRNESKGYIIIYAPKTYNLEIHKIKYNKYGLIESHQCGNLAEIYDYKYDEKERVKKRVLYHKYDNDVKTITSKSFVYNDKGLIKEWYIEGSDQYTKYEYNDIGKVISEKEWYGSFLEKEISFTYQNDLLVCEKCIRPYPRSYTKNYYYDCFHRLSKILIIYENKKKGTEYTYYVYNRYNNIVYQNTKAKDFKCEKFFFYRKDGKIKKEIEKNIYEKNDIYKHIKRFYYDNKGNLIKMAFDDGAAEIFTYDSKGRLIKNETYSETLLETLRDRTEYTYTTKS